VEAAGEQDGARLRRAAQAASLAAVGRAVYAAIVETVKVKTDGREVSRCHRDHLPRILEEHAALAGQLDMGKLLEDTVAIPAVLREVVEETLQWIGGGARQPMVLRDVYERAECDRKGQRARLSRVCGADRRKEWDNEKHALAEPLHFRWRQVSGLLDDLWDAA
jgi:hypothetical protein